MPTISGTPLSPLSATLLSELRDIVQNRLSDPNGTTFTDSLVQEWLLDAIRDYSNHFPRTIEATLPIVSGTTRYDLPANFQHIVRVEYPDGEENNDYTISPRRDETNADQLWLDQEPTADGTLRYWYTAAHPTDLGASDPITVPNHHHQILTLYAMWQATALRQSNQEISPTSNSSLLMAQLQQNAFRRERAYYTALSEAKKANLGQSGQVVWEMD
jgi:hypothetical protein